MASDHRICLLSFPQLLGSMPGMAGPEILTLLFLPPSMQTELPS